MAEYCKDDCVAICDFCKHYRDFGTKGIVGEGYCFAKREVVDITDSCDDDFECFRLDKYDLDGKKD